MGMSHRTDIKPEIQLLKQQIQQAASLLMEQPLEQNASGMGSLVYLGNHQDAVPRNLILDPHLESGEVHTWVLLKIHISNPGLPSMIPSQRDLMKYLKCSRPVLSRHLQVLRALRWITLCTQARGADGRFRGHVYAQHDKPLNLQDTLYLDPQYLEFLEQPSTGTVLGRLRQIKDAVLRHIDFQILDGIELERSPSQLEQLAAQFADSQADPLETPLACPAGATLPHRIANLYEASICDEKEPDKPDFYLDGATMHRVNPFYLDRVNFDTVTDRSCSSSYIKTTTTYDDLVFPKALQGSERSTLYAVKQLQALPKEMRQFALDYLADRIKAGEQGSDKPVGNAIRYLGWIVRNINAGTLPPSSYGIRKSQPSGAPSRLPSQTDRQQAHAAWVRSLKEKGFAVDATGTPKKLAKA
jgi:hypothetical protein